MALWRIIENTDIQNAENCCIQNTSYVVLLSFIPWNVQRVTCLFFVFTRAFRQVCMTGGIFHGIFTQDNPSVQSTVINGVLLTKN